ncbi:hypothetical protein C8Q75DRAFT_582894 [Abortiporus biennis]|nr:hypothetical protein C8Q75DRAFT_582894 [Abortiporus biennis]
MNMQTRLLQSLLRRERKRQQRRLPRPPHQSLRLQKLRLLLMTLGKLAGTSFRESLPHPFFILLLSVLLLETSIGSGSRSAVLDRWKSSNDVSHILTFITATNCFAFFGRSGVMTMTQHNQPRLPLLR